MNDILCTIIMDRDIDVTVEVEVPEEDMKDKVEETDFDPELLEKYPAYLSDKGTIEKADGVSALSRRLANRHQNCELKCIKYVTFNPFWKVFRVRVLSIESFIEHV